MYSSIGNDGNVILITILDIFKKYIENLNAIFQNFCNQYVMPHELSEC